MNEKVRAGEINFLMFMEYNKYSFFFGPTVKVG